MLLAPLQAPQGAQEQARADGRGRRLQDGWAGVDT